jgi:hypothetical protein
MDVTQKELVFVHSGVDNGLTTEEKKKSSCSSECVGGTASKSRMSATN